MEYADNGISGTKSSAIYVNQAQVNAIGTTLFLLISFLVPFATRVTVQGHKRKDQHSADLPCNRKTFFVEELCHTPETQKHNVCEVLPTPSGPSKV